MLKWKEQHRSHRNSCIEENKKNYKEMKINDFTAFFPWLQTLQNENLTKLKSEQKPTRIMTKTDLMLHMFEN